MRSLFFWTGAVFWFGVATYIFWALVYILKNTFKDIVTLTKIAHQTMSRVELVKYWFMLWFAFACLFLEQAKAHYYGYEISIVPTPKK